MNTNLTEYLDLASRAYYDGEPIIPDHIFDLLAERVGYNRVGAKPGNLGVALHKFRMYSLKKFYAEEGTDPPFTNPDEVTTLKLDGAAISLYYENGVLQQALTRGDGVVGQIITDKIIAGNKKLGIPSNVAGLTIQVTGEIVAPNYIENARNYASGALSLLDLNEFLSRELNFIAYGVTPTQHATYRSDLTLLYGLGFTTVLDLPKDHEYFPTDGKVIRINNNKEFEDLGYTSEFPRGAYALKTRQDPVFTTLLKVEWQVGKTGRVTPVAILEPVKIGDALISRATLNNPEFIKSLDLNIGDRVGVIRSGEIIPCIVCKE